VRRYGCVTASQPPARNSEPWPDVPMFDLGKRVSSVGGSGDSDPKQPLRAYLAWPAS
jgi:hypothetical protein